ncbi:hypothetical protein ACJX0J_006056, partial [Zea mays]
MHHSQDKAHANKNKYISMIVQTAMQAMYIIKNSHTATFAKRKFDLLALHWLTLISPFLLFSSGTMFSNSDYNIAPPHVAIHICNISHNIFTAQL